MYHIKHTEKGFSLIEVMIAVLVLGIGILAVSKLQSSLIKSGSDANYRSVASSIAQKKIEDLRRFVHLTTVNDDVPDIWSAALSPTSLAFDHIANNQGGIIPSGTYSVDSGITYTLSWSSDTYYYSATNSAPTTTVSDEPAFKLIHVIAKWVGVGDNTNSVVSLDTVIDAYNPAFTDLGTSTIAGGEELKVDYDPLTAPDVVPITLDADGINKETSKPLPDLSRKGDSTLVTFDTVTYSTSFDTLRREEFRTVACKCKTGTTNNAPIIGYTTWDTAEETLTDITTVDHTGTINKTDVDTAQDTNNECYICCPQADDVTGSDFKVCRLKRVDGILRAFSPWKLVGFNMIPASYFNDSDGLSGMTSTQQAMNIALYSNYVTSLIRDVLAANGSASDLDNYLTINTSFINQTNTFKNTGPYISTTSVDHLAFVAGNANNRQIQVRGVYMDYPPSGIYTTEVISPSTTITYSAVNVPLDRVPFYEVNLTQLAGWIPDIQDNNNVNANNDGDLGFDSDYTDNHDEMDADCVSENINTPPTTRNYVTNEEFFGIQGAGTFVTCNNASRGVFYPISTTAQKIIESRIFTGSDGIVDRKINNNATIDISLDLEVQ